MKLYDGGRAPDPRRVRIFLVEKAIDILPSLVDSDELEPKTPAFKAMIPMQRSPVLELDGGTAISESMAIGRYVEALHPHPVSFGRDPRDQALVDKWSRCSELDLSINVANVMRDADPAMAHLEVPQVAEVADAGRSRVSEGSMLLNGALSVCAHVEGYAFGVADITGPVAVDVMRPAKLEMAEDLPNLARSHAAIKARPSASV